MIRTRSHAPAPGGLPLGLALLPPALALALAPAEAAAGKVCPETASVALIAGQNTTAGDVKVCNDADNLYVTYEPTGPWCVADTNLHVATGLDGIPRTKSGSPQPDQFAYGGPPEDEPCTVTIEIPLDEIGAEGVAAEDTVVIAAQADLVNLHSSEEEGAWAAGTRFTARGNWATYFTYTVEEPYRCGGDEDSLCVFVTSTVHNGALGGLIGADGICNDRAREANLPGAGSYMAWLSDSTQSPSTRFATADEDDTTEYRLVDGTLVANGWAALTTPPLEAPIALTEGRDPISSRFAVWTNTTTAGAAYNVDPVNTCANFTAVEDGPDDPYFSTVGDARATGAEWTDFDSPTCRNALRLYCFQQ